MGRQQDPVRKAHRCSCNSEDAVPKALSKRENVMFNMLKGLQAENARTSTFRGSFPKQLARTGSLPPTGRSASPRNAGLHAGRLWAMRRIFEEPINVSTAWTDQVQLQRGWVWVWALGGGYLGCWLALKRSRDSSAPTKYAIGNWGGENVWRTLKTF